MSEHGIEIDVALEEAMASSLKELRTMRIELAKKQLDQVEDTVDAIISQGQAPERSRNRLIREVSAILVERIVSLTERNSDGESVHFDELQLYIDLI